MALTGNMLYVSQGSGIRDDTGISVILSVSVQNKTERESRQKHIIQRQHSGGRQKSSTKPLGKISTAIIGSTSQNSRKRRQTEEISQ